MPGKRRFTPFLSKITSFSRSIFHDPWNLRYQLIFFSLVRFSSTIKFATETSTMQMPLHGFSVPGAICASTEDTNPETTSLPSKTWGQRPISTNNKSAPTIVSQKETSIDDSVGLPINYFLICPNVSEPDAR